MLVALGREGFSIYTYSNNTLTPTKAYDTSNLFSKAVEVTDIDMDVSMNMIFVLDRLTGVYFVDISQ
jgi:hypothetical protein